MIKNIWPANIIFYYKNFLYNFEQLTIHKSKDKKICKVMVDSII